MVISYKARLRRTMKKKMIDHGIGMMGECRRKQYRWGDRDTLRRGGVLGAEGVRKGKYDGWRGEAKRGSAGGALWLGQGRLGNNVSGRGGVFGMGDSAWEEVTEQGAGRGQCGAGGGGRVRG